MSAFDFSSHPLEHLRVGVIRRRRTAGWIILEKRTTPHRWVAHWYLKDSYLDATGHSRYRQGSHVLGFKTKGDLPTKSAAQQKWNAESSEVIGGARTGTAQRDAVPTFQSFLDTEFIQARRSRWNNATRAKLSYFFNLMCESFGPFLLADIDKKTLQRFLNDLASRFCHDTVSGCYSYLKAAFAEAVEQKLISESPARTLVMPHTRDRDNYTVPLEDVQRIEAALAGRDRILFKLLSRCGPRAGEAFAFQWQDLQSDQTLRIERTYSRGEIKPPKTKKSRKPIYLPSSLYQELLALRKISPDPSPLGWVFPSQRRRRCSESGQVASKSSLMPLDYHNWVNRHLKPVAQKLGVRVNCQIMRRTFATLANDVGGGLKDIQTQMRHARAATTADIYVQPIPRSVRESMERLDQVLGGRSNVRRPKVRKQRRTER